ncbi:MAG: peptidylprolyl isomerase [Thermoguttaceae bacterium]
MTQNCLDSKMPCKRILGIRQKRFYMVLGSLLAVALCLTVRHYWPASSIRAQSVQEEAPQPEQAAPAKKSPAQVTDVAATVNNQRILRTDLAAQCRRNHGQEVLESMVNKRLIVAECRRQNVRVTRDEVHAEIQRMAKRFNIPVDQWLKMLKQERNITGEQYADDIIWPTLALRKLAGERLTITKDELIREFETEYGEAVRARLIAVSTVEKAKKLHALAKADPDDFGNLAKNNSEDSPSASAKGIINPIRKHGSYQEIEDAVFNMKDGEISPVLHAGGQYVILKREGLLPARPVKFEQAAPRLEEILRDRKMRTVAQNVFEQLQKDAKVENIWNDPVRHRTMPTVAAMINGEPVTIHELDEECIARHGVATLEGMIHRMLLEQACRRKGIAVTEKDLQKEIARAALAGVKPKADGSPDVETWLREVTKRQGVPLETYRDDVVWPSVALKKLVGDQVEVSEEDLHKGFEANYGPRVRCLAIVLDNQRRAQQVFDLARKKNTSEFFGDLAEQYSVEPSSQAMRGEVPPIKRFGGKPQLEQEAFSLQPGELSGIIQMGDKFVILRCEEFTKPTANITFDMVRNDIYEDLREKKLRVAMADCFENLQESATVDNYLSGASHEPARTENGRSARNPQSRDQRPTK